MPKYMSREEIDEWAEERYEKSFFAQTIIECWGPEDYEGIDKQFLLQLEDAKNEQCAAARSEIF